MALTDEAIDRIKAMLVSGELQPGERLPKEEVLAVQLGLSRSSLREAVRALTAMRILVAKQGDGTYVSSLEPHLLLESLSFVADVSQGEAAMQLLQIRRLVEPQATAVAAARISDAEVASLREVLAASIAADNLDEFIRLDCELHRRIALVVGNPVLSLLLEILSTQTQRVRLLRGTRVGPAIEDVHREHTAIVDALAARDPQLAAAAATVHVAAVERWLAVDGD
ncbi:FadR/GntR family transcriptional regulator [Streptacidiphilus sp. N1-12]|uniref:FadR/GntR family transcriptional regulator n=2 Tax=Streptacidiphilus alkalitolerans TaxID=3342712 RepID=A0ABV6VKU5_9ACTN